MMESSQEQPQSQPGQSERMIEEEKLGEITYQKLQSQQQKSSLQNSEVPFIKSGDSVTAENTTEKFEYFDSQNLLLLMKLVSTEGYLNDPRTSHLKEQLEHYWQASDFPAQRTRVLYRYSKRQAEWEAGRLYSWTESRYHENREKMVGLQSLPKWVRAALASKFYFDLDIVNAHPSILLSVARFICGDEPKEFPNLTYYCQNREKVLELMSYFLNLGPVNGSDHARSEAKQAVTALFFGGRLPDNGNVSFKFIADCFNFDRLIAEIEGIGKLLLIEASKIADLGNQQQKLLDYANGSNSKYNCLLSLHKVYALLTAERSSAEEEVFSKKEMYKLLAHFLQDIERRIMAEIERTLEKEGDRAIDVYIHDGCLVRKKLVSLRHRKKKQNKQKEALIDWDSDTLKDTTKQFNFEQTFPPYLIQSCEQKIFLEFGLEIKIMMKPLDASDELRARLQASHLPLHDNNSPLQSPLKTFDELLYYYERCRNLCYITDRSKFLYGTELVAVESLKNCLEEPYFKKQQPQNGGRSYNSEEKGCFVEHYLKLNSRARFSKIELVKNPILKRGKSKDVFGSFSVKTNPFRVLNTGKNSTFQHTKYLLDLEVGFPLFSEERQLNGSLESMEEFQNYLAIGRLDNFREEEDQLSTEPLFPLDIFYDYDDDDEGEGDEEEENENEKHRQQLLLFEESPMAIPYFNHWWLLLGEDKECFEYVILWIAKITNSPGDMSNISGLAFYSKEQGIGKSLAIKMTLSLFDPFVQETQSVEQVFTRFSDLMEFVLLLHIEDPPRQHIHKFHDELKGRMTADKIFVEKKNQSMYNVTNFCRIMLSTNEDMALKLTPEDRRWAAFECSAALHKKRGYFNDLARYWKLHQSKCQVMRVLQGLDVEQFDAEKQRPMTPYLYKLMYANKSKMSNTYNNSLMGDLEETLVYNFLTGLKECLRRVTPQKVKKVMQPLEIFHHSEIENKVGSYKKKNNKHHSCYYIKFSVLADLFYLWAYGLKTSCTVSFALWSLLNNDSNKKSKVHQEFKRVLLFVAPELTSQMFSEKCKFYYYVIDPNIPSQKRDCTSQFVLNQPVDLFKLYKELTFQCKDLAQNFSMSQDVGRRSHYNSQPLIFAEAKDETKDEELPQQERPQQQVVVKNDDSFPINFDLDKENSKSMTFNDQMDRILQQNEQHQPDISLGKLSDSNSFAKFFN
jgi:hypothetical protein